MIPQNGTWGYCYNIRRQILLNIADIAVIFMSFSIFGKLLLVSAVIGNDCAKLRRENVYRLAVVFDSYVAYISAEFAVQRPRQIVVGMEADLVSLEGYTPP